MTVVFPEGVSAQGNIRFAFVPAIADTSAPSVAEIDATGAVDLSCFVTGTFSVTREQSTGEDRRACSKEVFQVLGRVTNSVPATEYVYDPQQPMSDPVNKAYSTLKQGTRGFLVIRYGKDAREDDWAAGDIVDIVPVECGVQVKLGVEDDEFAKLRVQQAFGVTGPLIEDVALVA